MCGRPLTTDWRVAHSCRCSVCPRSAPYRMSREFQHDLWDAGNGHRSLDVGFRTASLALIRPPTTTGYYSCF